MNKISNCFKLYVGRRASVSLRNITLRMFHIKKKRMQDFFPRSRNATFLCSQVEKRNVFSERGNPLQPLNSDEEEDGYDSPHARRRGASVDEFLRGSELGRQVPFSHTHAPKNVLLCPVDQLIKPCVHSQVWHCTSNVAFVFQNFAVAVPILRCCNILQFVWIVQVTWFDNTVQLL